MTREEFTKAVCTFLRAPGVGWKYADMPQREAVAFLIEARFEEWVQMQGRVGG